MNALEVLSRLAVNGCLGAHSSLVEELTAELRTELAELSDSLYLREKNNRLNNEITDLTFRLNELQGKYDRERGVVVKNICRDLLNNKEAMSTVRAFIAQGDKIAAIKFVRSNSTLGLKEAKDFVDDVHVREGK